MYWGGMKKLNIKKIYLADLFTSNLGIRLNAENLFKQLENKDYEKIVMDFKNVKFMSRSFAQEYVSRKKLLNIPVTEENISDNVQEMFNLVKTDAVKV